MVQIMLHVSVSVFKSNYLGYLLTRALNSLEHCFIFGACRWPCSLTELPFSCMRRREFLPLPCFDDRDLKEAQRERRYSYREFLDSKPLHENSAGDPDIAFGNGKRGQPLKVMIRGTDPKADMILDVLVRSVDHSCLSPLYPNTQSLCHSVGVFIN